MTTRTPPTADDLAGRSDAGKAAYNERRSMLRERGLRVPPDLYGQDALDDESDPTGAQRFWRYHAAEPAWVTEAAEAAETAKDIEYERETQRLVDLANPKTR